MQCFLPSSLLCRWDGLSSIISGSCHKYHFVATKVLSQQAYFCHSKRRVLLWQIWFVMTKGSLCNKYLLRQTYFCHNKRFVATKDVLSRQKRVFVVTKMVLVAAPTNDRIDLGGTVELVLSVKYCKILPLGLRFLWRSLSQLKVFLVDLIELYLDLLVSVLPCGRVLCKQAFTWHRYLTLIWGNFRSVCFSKKRYKFRLKKVQIAFTFGCVVCVIFPCKNHFQLTCGNFRSVGFSIKKTRTNSYHLWACCVHDISMQKAFSVDLWKL